MKVKGDILIETSCCGRKYYVYLHELKKMLKTLLLNSAKIGVLSAQTVPGRDKMGGWHLKGKKLLKFIEREVL